MIKKKFSKTRRYPLTHFFLIVTCIIILLPILFTLLYSFFPKSEIDQYWKLRNNYDSNTFMPLLFSPRTVSIRQYYTLFIEDQSYLYLFLNSVLYSSLIVIGQAIFIPTMAYSLSRFEFRGRNVLYFLVLVLMVLPFQVTMAPNVIALRAVGLLGTIWAVVIPNWIAPFYIFLIRQFMVSLPCELYEAGMMDGAGSWRLYWSVTIPVCKPVLCTAAVLSFSEQWNMVEQPLAYLQDMSQMPISVIFGQLSDEKITTAFAGAALCILPMLFIYLYFQDGIITGLQLSELK